MAAHPAGYIPGYASGCFPAGGVFVKQVPLNGYSLPPCYQGHRVHNNPPVRPKENMNPKKDSIIVLYAVFFSYLCLVF